MKNLLILLLTFVLTTMNAQVKKCDNTIKKEFTYAYVDKNHDVKFKKMFCTQLEFSNYVNAHKKISKIKTPSKTTTTKYYDGNMKPITKSQWVKLNREGNKVKNEKMTVTINGKEMEVKNGRGSLSDQLKEAQEIIDNN